MTERDVKEVGSKFWNEGKWNNFILPFLPDDCSEQVLIDIGCNSGLFLKMAKDKGFDRVVGVDSDHKAVEKGIRWRDRNGYDYNIVESRMEECVDSLPLADYTILSNTHYYFTINDWLDYLDRLQYKTRYCIIVTAEKRHVNHCWAHADVASIRRYFKGWEEVGFIDELPTKDDPSPRRMWGLCFRSPHLDRVELDKIGSVNEMQGCFYKEIDGGIPFNETEYYSLLKNYRYRWSEDKLNNWFKDRIDVYTDIKKCGVKKPIIVDDSGLILDGNHKYGMVKNIGYRTTFIRRT
jgi:hypothetical protein